MVGELIKGGIFKQYIDDLIRRPIIEAGGLVMAIKIGITITKTITSAKSIKDANQLEVMAMYIQAFSYVLALLPFAMSRPRILNIMIKIGRSARKLFSMQAVPGVKHNLTNVLVDTLLNIAQIVLKKISSNFMIMLIMVIIVIPISALGLVITKAVTASITERQKAADKEETGVVSSFVNAFAANPNDIFNAFKGILRNIKKSAVETFPLLNNIIEWIIQIINKLKSLGTTIGNTIKTKIATSQDKENKGDLQESKLVKYSLIGIVGAVLIMILKKSPIGGMVGLFALIASKLGKGVTDSFNTGPIGKIINMFKAIGTSIAKRFGILEILGKGKTITKSLKTMDTVNESLKEIK